MIGQTIGPYQILAKLGEGGMGEVYRARDSKLKREVAIKVLPADVANDHERLARFQREAEVLASLNHPHIAHVYGIEANALVMELVEGEDLSQRIARGPIPLDEALPIAKQIAEALEAAHDAGIVHRDLKPANVKVRPDGAVKVLDFGLAKAIEQGSGIGDQGSGSLANSPTITSPAMTMRGVILGTAAYMSPEQAKGKAVDRRADIWAFGCVLYEMLTAKRAFKGDDVTDIITAVMRDQPDWNVLPPTTPASILTLLRRCLEKDPRNRAPHIAVARMEIADAMTTTGELVGRAPALPARLKAWPIAVAVAGMLVTGAGGYWLASSQPTPPGPVVRSTLLISGSLSTRAPSQRFALSPDGRRLAYVSTDPVDGRVRLFSRVLDGAAGSALPGTDGAIGPFWAPDSRFIAFYSGGDLKKIDVTGGPAITVCASAVASAQSYASGQSVGNPGSWSRDDVIVFRNAATLARVPARGGTPEPITQLNADRQETAHDHPSFLPDGRHIVYTSFGEGRSLGTYVASLDGGQPVKLTDGGMNPQYAAGHLLFARDAAILAQPFDVSTRQLSGTASAIAESVLFNVTTSQPGAALSVSQSGALIYQTTADQGAGSRLSWFTRTGAETPLLNESSPLRDLAISPNGTHAAITPLDTRGRSDLWIIDVARGTRSRFTNANNSMGAVWAADGRSVLYLAGGSFFRKPLDGGGEQRLPGIDPGGFPLSWSPDGRVVLFERNNPGTQSDIMTLSVDGAAQPVKAAATPASERFAQFSPDGRWIAYMSNESGAGQIYVTRTGGTERWQISIDGGNYPRWGRNGRELFFFATTENKLAVAQLEVKGNTIAVSAITKLFTARAPDGFGRSFYDVGPDGRFLMEVPAVQAAETKVTLVTNWPQLLEKAP